MVLCQMKRLDDKNLLIEIQIIESRVYYEIHNVPRAKVRRVYGMRMSMTPEISQAVCFAAHLMHVIPRLQQYGDTFLSGSIDWGKSSSKCHILSSSTPSRDRLPWWYSMCGV